MKPFTILSFCKREPEELWDRKRSYEKQCRTISQGGKEQNGCQNKLSWQTKKDGGWKAWAAREMLNADSQCQAIKVKKRYLNQKNQ